MYAMRTRKRSACARHAEKVVFFSNGGLEPEGQNLSFFLYIKMKLRANLSVQLLS